MKKLLLLIAIIPLIAMSCKKDPSAEAAHFTINYEDIALGATSVTITVTFSYPSAIDYIKGYVSEHNDMSNASEVFAVIYQNTFVIRFDDLTPNKHYYYQYEYSTGVDLNTTEIKGFTTNDYSAPTVTTAEVSEITASTAVCGGVVVDDGGLTVTARGVCWSLSHNPTINDNHTSDGQGVGSFVSNLTITGLDTYYVRAYATNSNGTSYGDEKSFAVYIPKSGLFSVSDTKQVRLALGNLQYQASTNTWRFAEHSWDFVGYENYYHEMIPGNVFEFGEECDNELASSTYSGWIDRFAWGTSGYNHGAVCYQPWSTESTASNYYAYGIAGFNLYNMSGMADWGYNPISNGGNQENQWRTMTDEEFIYLVNRNNRRNCRAAYVNGVPGFIMLPDDWNESTYQLNNYNFISNIVSSQDWTNVIEKAGAVFLPLPDKPSHNTVDKYWTSSCLTNGQPYSVYNTSNTDFPSLTPNLDFGYRRCMVRLVRDEE